MSGDNTLQKSHHVAVASQLVTTRAIEDGSGLSVLSGHLHTTSRFCLAHGDMTHGTWIVTWAVRIQPAALYAL